MLARTALRASGSTRVALGRRAYSAPATSAGPVRQFFANGVPVDVYPLIFLTGGVATFAMFSISKHIFQDRDHLRWLPGQGGVKFNIKSE